MEFIYSDIIGLGRPTHDGDAFSRRHPKMAQLNRAKIFAPFAALSGYDEAVRAKQVPYVPRRQRDAEALRALNRALAVLERATRTGPLARRNRVAARVEYFEACRDPNHDAFGQDGLYHAFTGVVWKVDTVEKVLVIGEKTLRFADIHSITFSTENTIAK